MEAPTSIVSLDGWSYEQIVRFLSHCPKCNDVLVLGMEVKINTDHVQVNCLSCNFGARMDR